MKRLLKNFSSRRKRGKEKGKADSFFDSVADGYELNLWDLLMSGDQY